LSKDIMDKLFAIQDAANGCATKREGVEEMQTPSPLFSRVHVDTPVEWKRAEILDALKKGATSKALLLGIFSNLPMVLTPSPSRFPSTVRYSITCRALLIAVFMVLLFNFVRNSEQSSNIFHL